MYSSCIVYGSVPLVEVSLQFHGFTPFVATASAVVKLIGCLSGSRRSSTLSNDLPLAIKKKEAKKISHDYNLVFQITTVVCKH
jgi:hypothetical protein